MKFISNYFQLCDDLCLETGSCLKTTPYYFCVFNSGIIPVLFLVAVISILYRFLTYRENFITRYFKQPFQQSIFYYLKKDYPKKSILLYFLMAYGIFFLRPLGFLIINLINGSVATPPHNGFVFISVLITSITSTLYFFSVIFMVNFYGVKAEILLSKGDPSIEVKERALFLKMVLKRSFTFCLIFFCGSMLNAVFANVPLGSAGDSSSKQYEWVLRIMSYGFVAILLINRFNYVNYAQRMVRLRVLKKNKIYNAISLNKHVEDHSITQEMLPKLLESISSYKETEFAFIKEFEKIIVQKCGQSSFIFNETAKILNDTKIDYQPILRNPMENHLIGTFWLFFTLFDGLYNLLASPAILIYHIIKPNDESGIVPFISILILFGFYVCETTIQSLLVYFIIRNKANFGDHLEIESNGSETSEFDWRFSLLPIENQY